MSPEENPEPVPELASAGDDGLLDRAALVEAQPLAERAAGFDLIAEELLAELQRSDHEGAGA
ncbi:hypothetical protein BMH32_12705 [Leucobacter sp. OLJS4]|uniref:hypothetical protein n=1 Tax=unclassified Leucobacter TaxID=2621730 RepID=UPI000C1A2BC5|nr:MULTISPECIES: hypothetical protein [unclassified Leucobacter]PIJ55049.1 hypothetical protein BMH30_01810 [Leucobacter sp. OLES1]PII85555.1 hypothetical protein BMH25_01765 [Leucobacter sp. OLCALW19]PII91705.1 hypothetical protein BMH27_06050 [Leucobacter sp. OLAS13]PII94708.1 hypothetical protein BMH26_02430 [Leucobacter sp. OLTLW20]PII96602.1 hypothetical protein BMH29_15275 [Leucobacter sp. OLDS2]